MRQRGEFSVAQAAKAPPVTKKITSINDVIQQLYFSAAGLPQTVPGYRMRAIFRYSRGEMPSFEEKTRLK